MSKSKNSPRFSGKALRILRLTIESRIHEYMARSAMAALEAERAKSAETRTEGAPHAS